MAISIHGPADTSPADAVATVLECSQFVTLHGLTKPQALALHDAGRERIVERTVQPGDTPPWAHSWYRVGADGRLDLWRYNWDSSG